MSIFSFVHFMQRQKTSPNVTNEWPMTKPCLKTLAKSYFKVAYNKYLAKDVALLSVILHNRQ